MELFFETRRQLESFQGDIRHVEVKPQVHPEPIIQGDTPYDRRGTSIYGTVLKDGGMFRMWYMATPENRGFTRVDSASVGYAESHNGIDWIKPNLKQNGDSSNICNFSLQPLYTHTTQHPCKSVRHPDRLLP